MRPAQALAIVETSDDHQLSQDFVTRLIQQSKTLQNMLQDIGPSEFIPTVPIPFTFEQMSMFEPYLQVGTTSNVELSNKAVQTIFPTINAQQLVQLIKMADYFAINSVPLICQFGEQKIIDQFLRYMRLEFGGPGQFGGKPSPSNLQRRFGCAPSQGFVIQRQQTSFTASLGINDDMKKNIITILMDNCQFASLNQLMRTIQNKTKNHIDISNLTAIIKHVALAYGGAVLPMQRPISVKFNPNGKSIMFGSLDNEIAIFDLYTGRLQQIIPAPLNDWYAVRNTESFSPDGKFIVTLTMRSAVLPAANIAKIWNVNNGKQIATLSGHTGNILSVKYSFNGQLIATASDDDTAKIWSASTGNLQRTLIGHTDWINDITFSPNDQFVATAGDNTAKIWNVSTGNLQRTLMGHTDFVFGITYSPDGKFIATASFDSTAKIWDSATGNLILTLNHPSRVYTVQFSPDGKFILTRSRDSVKIWKSASGELVRSLESGGFVSSAKYSPDGRFIVTAREDTATIWDAFNYTIVNEFQTSRNNADFSPDSKMLAVIRDGRIEIHNIFEKNIFKKISNLDQLLLILAIAHAAQNKTKLLLKSDLKTLFNSLPQELQRALADLVQ